MGEGGSRSRGFMSALFGSRRGGGGGGAGGVDGNEFPRSEIKLRQCFLTMLIVPIFFALCLCLQSKYYEAEVLYNVFIVCAHYAPAFSLVVTLCGKKFGQNIFQGCVPLCR